MWSEFRAVKVIAWRILSRLRKEGWPKDLLDMLYLEDDDLRFAKETGEHLEEAEKIIHRDANGAILQAGDSVVLIKDLKVKGSSLVAKQGTAVRRISLDHENAKYIEGKVGPTQIVIITDYVKKMTEKEGFPKGELGRIGVAISRSNPNVVYALVEAKKNALYKSEDGGFLSLIHI